jgi:hypothetical protein
MSRLKVHVLNFHSIHSHIEIVLENMSATPSTYYSVNRWYPAMTYWSRSPQSFIKQASSVFSFEIDEDPNAVIAEWRNFWLKTECEASILGHNCSVSAQWFLKRFANIPEPNLSNISFNHFFLGIVWPSFIPSLVTLPGRVFSNAKFYINAMHHPEIAAKYSRLFLYTTMAAAIFAFAASAFLLAASVAVLSTGLATLASVGCAAVGIASSVAFFKSYNTLSAKNIYEDLKKSPNTEDAPSLVQEVSMA